MPMNRSELRTWLELVSGIRALLDALDRRLRAEAGISHDEYMILSRLHRERRPVRMSDLAEAVSYSPSRLSHTAARLELEGWIERTRGRVDKRVVEARLTAAGSAKVRAASGDHLRLVERLVFESLGPETAREVAHAMGVIRHAAESEA